MTETWQPCTHTGPCSSAHFIRDCGAVQFAGARKYDVNLVWQFAELRPNLFALYNPIHRDVACIGTIEDCLAVYRARTPYVYRPGPKQEPKFSGLTFNL